MVYILQTSISEELRLDKALLGVYGVGANTAKTSIYNMGLLMGSKGKDLRRLHRINLKHYIEDYPTNLGEDLKQKSKTNVQRLIDIISYRGRRHKGGYPVRGQRSHTNASTQKRLHKRWLISTYEKPKLNTTSKTKVKPLKKRKN